MAEYSLLHIGSSSGFNRCLILRTSFKILSKVRFATLIHMPLLVNSFLVRSGDVCLVLNAQVTKW